MKFIIVCLVSLFVLVGCSPYDQGRNQFLSHEYTASFKNLLPVARQGNADAQYAVGYMYYNGKGVKRDDHLALYWFHKAASQGQPSAIKALKMIQRSREAQPFPAPRGLYSSNSKHLPVEMTTAHT